MDKPSDANYKKTTMNFDDLFKIIVFFSPQLQKLSQSKYRSCKNNLTASSRKLDFTEDPREMVKP